MRELPTEVLVLGTGATARWHAAAVRRWLPEVHLVIAGRNIEAAREVAVEFGATAATLQDALGSAATGCCWVIATLPPVARAEWVRRALQSGRDVLSEKPLASSLQEARELLSLARSEGRLLACCSSRFLEHPATVAVREQLRAGLLGKLLQLQLIQRRNRARPGIEYQPQSSWFLDSKQSGGGVLLDWGPYDLALIDEVLSPEVIEIRAAAFGRPVTASDPAGLDPLVEQQVRATLLTHGPFGSVPVHWERTACSHLPEQELTAVEGECAALSWQWKDWEPGEFFSYQDEGGLWNKRGGILARSFAPAVHERPLLGLLRHSAGDEGGALVGPRLEMLVETLFAIQLVARDGLPRTVTRPAG
jgi:predicted dehydrogenase